MADNRNQSGSQGGGQSDSNNRDQRGQSDQNRSGNQSGNQNARGDDINSNDANVEGWQPGQVGAVEDESHDGRLKENRMEGKTLGTTQHSREAPHSIQKDENDEGRSGGSYGSGGNNDQSGSGQGSSSGGNQGGNNR